MRPTTTQETYPPFCSWGPELPNIFAFSLPFRVCFVYQVRAFLVVVSGRKREKQIYSPWHVYILHRRGRGDIGVRELKYFVVPVEWERHVLFCFQLLSLSQAFTITVIALWAPSAAPGLARFTFHEGPSSFASWHIPTGASRVKFSGMMSQLWEGSYLLMVPIASASMSSLFTGIVVYWQVYSITQLRKGFCVTIHSAWITFWAH